MMISDSWINWIVPQKYVKNYLLTLFMGLWFIPKYLFGLSFTTLGLLFNLVILDMLFWRMAKNKELIEEELKKRNDRRDDE
jgi:hypothetical protein